MNKIKNDRDLESTLSLHTNYNVTQTDNYNHITQLHLQCICNTIIDLLPFNNINYIYLYDVRDIKLLNLPNKLKTIYIKYMNKNIQIPYKETINNIVLLSSMGECFCNFTNSYHKYKDDNFDFYKYYWNKLEHYSNNIDIDVEKNICICNS